MPYFHMFFQLLLYVFVVQLQLFASDAAHNSEECDLRNEFEMQQMQLTSPAFSCEQKKPFIAKQPRSTSLTLPEPAQTTGEEKASENIF